MKKDIKIEPSIRCDHGYNEVFIKYQISGNDSFLKGIESYCQKWCLS